MNIRDENVLRELNLYPLWVRRDTPVEGPAGVAFNKVRQSTTRQVGCGIDTAENDNRQQAGSHKAVMLESGEADTQQSAMGIVEPVLSQACPEPSRRVEGLNPSYVSSLDWNELKEKVYNCTACKLRGGCTQTVFGVGDEKAEWLFVGEGPGADEDVQGEPFVGQAGKLLDSMLAAIKLKRGNNVYIANIVKCRPPNNRTPEPDEITTCIPYLQQQIALIKPKLIVALGKTAATSLLGRDATLGSLRGTVHDYKGTPLIVTYHPAYLLRSPAEKAKAWQDLCFAVQRMAE